MYDLGSLELWRVVSLWGAHNSVVTTLDYLNYIALEWLDSFDNFHSVKTKTNAKVFLQIDVSDMLNDLSVNTNFLEPFTVLGQFEFVDKPIRNIQGVPLFERFEFGGVGR